MWKGRVMDTDDDNFLAVCPNDVLASPGDVVILRGLSRGGIREIVCTVEDTEASEMLIRLPSVLSLLGVLVSSIELAG